MKAWCIGQIFENFYTLVLLERARKLAESDLMIAQETSLEELCHRWQFLGLNLCDDEFDGKSH
jgi:hypothetical protein